LQHADAAGREILPELRHAKLKSEGDAHEGNMKLIAACLLLLVSLVVGCDYVAQRGGDQVKGSGNRKTESRDVPEFNELVVSGAYRVEIDCGKSRSLELEADDNILPLIKTEVAGGRLELKQERGFKVDSLPLVRINVPDLKSLSVPGAGDIRLDDVSNATLKLTIDGAGKLRASGETGTLDLTLNGAGLIDAQELRAQTATVVSNGAGHASVHASESLDATVNGVGAIDYYGNPKTVNPKVNGIGKINRK
jgi:hypothetical protein